MFGGEEKALEKLGAIASTLELRMHLRSRNFIKFGHQSMRDLARRILLEESVTLREGLETIVEDTSDVWSTTSKSNMVS